ncbi:MAG: radical SAM protein [Polyangiaceae bacterium]
MSEGSRATARVLLECNNGCVFCSQAGVTGGAPFGEQLETARRQGDEVTLVGGEPTLDPRLAEHVAAARRLGFVRVGLQTNGRRLAEAGYVAELARAGLTDVHLSIHGAESAAHDYHTGVAGSFDAALAGLAAARASSLTAVVNTVLTRSSFRSLAGMPKLLSQRGVAGWLVSVPRSAGRLSADFDRLMPRLGLAVPFALSALAAGEKLGLDVGIAGAPRCLLGEYTRWALDDGPHVDDPHGSHEAQGRLAPRAFAEACDGCPARAHCPGLDAAYLERFGGDELGPARTRMPATAARSTARDSRIARMFVGPGELGPPATRTPSPNADKGQKGKVALPLAGKVKPAVAEATAGSPRRSGEALKELFPGLFEGEPKSPPE